DLAEFRSMLGGTDYYRVTGEVVLTFQQNYRNQKFIQDASAAVLIDDPSGIFTTAYFDYDGLTGIVGKITEYAGMIEFLPAIDPGAASSSGNVIVPEVITLNDLLTNFENYESELVQIDGVTFADGGSAFATGTAYPISDASKAAGLFRTTFYDADYIGTTIPSEVADVTGIPNSRFDGDYLTSRSLADIVVPPYLRLIAPNGGEWIEQGSEYAITWESNLNDAFIIVSLIDDITKAVEILAEGLAVSDLSYTWTVTQALGDNYKISITQEEGKSLGDISADYFSIVPPFDVKITEIMYNTPGQDDWEFIELYNNGEGPVNLLDWKFTQGVDFSFPDHVLNPGEFVVSCINAEAFLNTFGIVAYQWTGGALGNSGEDIELTDNNDSVRAYVDYDDGGNWYSLTDGEGPSLTFCDPTLENNDPANWSASTKFAALTADGDALYCTPMAGCNTEPALPIFYSYGWTTMSSNLEPAKITLEDLFAPVNAKMIILLNDMGIYWPVQSINTIGDWDTYKGYKVKFDASAYFVFSGAALENRTFEYNAGQTFVPILSEGPISLVSLIPQLGSVEFMFDLNSGDVYWPDGGIIPGATGVIQTLYPGYAYYTKFTEAGSIDFGIAPPKANVSTSVAFENTTSWNNVSKTDEQHIISVSQTALNGLESGDVIGVFNAAGTCVGIANYSGGESVLPLVVYGDDFTTEAIDGMTAGENLNFRIYRSGEEISANAIYNFQIQNHDGLFSENGLSMINEFKLGATGIGKLNDAYSIYPNPGNGQFNIDVTGSFVVTISNAQGQMVYQGQINGNTMINLGNQSDGIYFVRLTGENVSIIEKVIIK
ncbi:MAG: lamin tail domain-containing protein, partial [Bacteroidales bacterium]|nr:lamin tail domain-containing protein [Bacteroidales bacterium]